MAKRKKATKKAEPKKVEEHIFTSEVRSLGMMMEAGYSHLEKGKRVVDSKTRILKFHEGRYHTSNPEEIKYIKDSQKFKDGKVMLLLANKKDNQDTQIALKQAKEEAEKIRAKAEAEIVVAKQNEEIAKESSKSAVATVKKLEEEIQSLKKGKAPEGKKE